MGHERTRFGETPKPVLEFGQARVMPGVAFKLFAINRAIETGLAQRAAESVFAVLRIHGVGIAGRAANAGKGEGPVPAFEKERGRLGADGVIVTDDECIGGR